MTGRTSSAATPEGPILFDVGGVASPEAVRSAMQEVKTALAETPLSEECQGDVQLLLAEVLNNVAEHAYAETGCGVFSAVAYRKNDLLHICVCDAGAAMPNKNLPVGKPRDLDVPLAELPEGGFGWFLIHALSQRINYRRLQGQNRLDIWMAANRG